MCKTTTRVVYAHYYVGVGRERVGVVATKCVYYIIYRRSDDIKTNELAKKPRKIHARGGCVYRVLCNNRAPEGLENSDVLAIFFFFTRNALVSFNIFST